MTRKVLLFDLDGTLLKSDKTISNNTLEVIQKCKQLNYFIGVSTSRSENNCIKIISEIKPEIIICSGGALIKYNNHYIYKAEFTVEETKNIINTVREICGYNCEITVDTLDRHYWNYNINPKIINKSWGESIYTDYTDFFESALKICVKISEQSHVNKITEIFKNYDVLRFTGSDWYKFTLKNVTKENAILNICNVIDINIMDVIAFGDDLVDIGMLKICGKGIAMGNSVNEVKSIADVIIDSNDNDGIAKYLTETLLCSNSLL